MFNWLQNVVLKKERTLERHLELEPKLIMGKEQSRISCFVFQGGIFFTLKMQSELKIVTHE